jgi:hypothetical protein
VQAALALAYHFGSNLLHAFGSNLLHAASQAEVWSTAGWTTARSAVIAGVPVRRYFWNKPV